MCLGSSHTFGNVAILAIDSCLFFNALRTTTACLCLTRVNKRFILHLNSGTQSCVQYTEMVVHRTFNVRSVNVRSVHTLDKVGEWLEQVPLGMENVAWFLPPPEHFLIHPLTTCVTKDRSCEQYLYLHGPFRDKD